jgi:hypothetical protein
MSITIKNFDGQMVHFNCAISKWIDYKTGRTHIVALIKKQTGMAVVDIHEFLKYGYEVSAHG